jgi:phenylacetate-CoA ligase
MTFTLARAADGISQLLRPVYYYLPRKFRAPGTYWNTLEFLHGSQYWDEQRIIEFQLSQLRAMLRHCARNVPYYRRLFRKIGFDPDFLKQLSDISCVPTLDKDTVRDNIHDFLAENIPASQRVYCTTGGTMGVPLGFYNLKDSGWRERAFTEMQASRVGFGGDQLRAILRGAVIRGKKHWTFDQRQHAYLFSNFHMTGAQVTVYARIMREKKVPFFHVYPSSALDFARLLQQERVEPPSFRAVLAGSENFYPGQRQRIEAFYGCRVYAWYGHSENMVLAGECETSHDYHVSPEYGFVEVLKADGSKASAEGDTGELVGTSFHNLAMPLVRYRTADWAVLGPEKCACGRKHKLLREVRGRWHQEMLVGKFNNRISMTALNVHSDIFDRVNQFQFFQNEIGKVELRLVPKTDFSQSDAAAILATFSEKMGDSVDLQLVPMDKLPLTERGKFRFIVQELKGLDAPQSPECEPIA